jgi:hypothetical protein
MSLCIDAQSDIGDITWNLAVIDGLIKLIEPMAQAAVNLVLANVAIPIPAFSALTLSSPVVRRANRCANAPSVGLQLWSLCVWCLPRSRSTTATLALLATSTSACDARPRMN